MFKFIKTYLENKQLKSENDRLETEIEATKKALINRNKEYRALLGEREETRELIADFENQMNEIIKTAQQNTYGDDSYKLKKIIELAKFEDSTSSIK